MAQDRIGTAFNVRAQRRQDSVAWIAIGIVSDVAQRIGMQACALCNDSQAPILQLLANEF